MPKVFLKDIFVEIRHSLGRFISIMLIVALGVAFFAGIKASAPDMNNSADWYFDKYNVQDIQLYSTIGLDQQDIDAIKKLDDVESVQGQFTIDALTRKGSQEQVVKVITYQDDQDLNIPRLVEGRMPELPDECLIEADSVNTELFGSYTLGSRIQLYSATDTPITDTLKYSTYIIVGKAYSPNYLSYEKGTSTAGSGSVDTFIYIEQAALKADYFTEIDIAVKGAKDINTYSDDYFALVEPVVQEIEDIASTQISRRIAQKQKIVDDAREEMNKKLADAKSQLDDGKEQLDKAYDAILSGLEEIAGNEDKLASSRSELEAGWNTYYSNKQQIESGLTQVNDGIAQIQQAQAQLPALKAQKESLENAIRLLPILTNALVTIQEIQVQYNDLKAQLEQTQQENPDDPLIEELLNRLSQLEGQLDQLIADICEDPNMSVDGAIAYITSARDKIIAEIGSVENGRQLLRQVDDGIVQIESLSGKLSELQSTKQNLLSAQSQLASAYNTLVSAQAQLEEGQKQLENAKEQIREGEQEYSEGKTEYDENKEKYDKEKSKAEEQIEDAQKQVDDLDGEWIVLDRNSHYSYRDYEACAQRMDGIASIFPVFFYLVAALVCMTTMTRMVAEQRNEIGTLKAMGYSKGQIAFKYLMYAGLASVSGCIIGCAIGMVVFPYVIFTAWNTMYNLEQIQFSWQPGLVLLASLSVTAIVLLATLYSIFRELMEVPSQLMRPKAAKAGKKILLEKIPWIWNRVSFMHKVTLRNLFRYKQRFFMTVVGIAGCSALLVAGFGLNDSISDIVAAQFERIYHYDAVVTANNQNDDSLLKKLENTNGVSAVYKEEILSVVIEFDNKDVSAYLNILDDPDSFSKFMTFYPMDGSSQDMELNDEGVFISIKTAEKMNLKVGDTIRFETADKQQLEAEVSGIFDQYINHQIYVTKKLYDTWHVKETPNTSYLILQESTEKEAENALGTRIMNLDGVKSISFYSSLQENFLNMISSIRMIVVVLVISAAMLAFVVLYNLSNVNISERLREIATIKVLGFTEKEVNQYVNRESVILALIGGSLGLYVGIYLHNIIMALAELDDVRFGRTINASSFAISLVMTMVFTFAINWIMKYKLRKIQMVESLKAVE